MVDLDELERLEREATPGPWKADTEDVGDCVVWAPEIKDGDGDSSFVSNIGRSRIGAVGVAFDHEADDCRLIAATRNALPDLLAELRTLRARVAEMERDAAAWAKVREAIGDDAHLFEAFAEPVRREHADTGIERAPVYDRVPVAIADVLRAEEGGSDA